MGLAVSRSKFTNPNAMSRQPATAQPIPDAGQDAALEREVGAWIVASKPSLCSMTMTACAQVVPAGSTASAKASALTSSLACWKGSEVVREGGLRVATARFGRA